MTWKQEQATVRKARQIRRQIERLIERELKLRRAIVKQMGTEKAPDCFHVAQAVTHENVLTMCQNILELEPYEM